MRDELQKPLRDANVVLLGAGGASRAIAATALADGCRALWIGNRDAGRLEDLIARLIEHFPEAGVRVRAFSLAEPPADLPCDALVVNATSLGLKPDDGSPFPAKMFSPGMAAYDTIYEPPETAFLKAARAAGASSANGLSMLCRQGASAFELLDRRACAGRSYGRRVEKEYRPEKLNRQSFFEMILENFRIVQAQMPWVFTVFAGLFGAIVGSFLNVCIFRIPKGRSIVSPASQCACGAPIPFYRNIPVLSWFALRGRAPCCGRKFSFRYPLVEALTAALFAASWALLPPAQAGCGFVFFALLVVIAFIDLDTMTIPDSVNLGLAAAGLLCSAVLPALHGEIAGPGTVNSLRALGDAGVGMLVGAGLVYWFRLIASLIVGREAMGEGDIILLGGIGAFCGWQGAVFSLFGGAVIGAVILLPILATRAIFAKKTARDARAGNASHAACEGDEFAEELAHSGFESAVPFGPWLAAGAVVWYLFLRTPVAEYVEQIGIILRLG